MRVLEVRSRVDHMGSAVVTGYRSKFFRYQCQPRGCYIAQLPSWDDIIECFPRNIRPTDVDGFIEINGHFLFLEEKQAGVGLADEGQRRALRELAKHTDTTVVFFRPSGDGMQVLVLGEGEPKGWQNVTRDEFKDWLRWWCKRADMPRARSA